jgi:putative FmdB family regulatory protein
VPTYQYACTECEHAFDQVQSFTDDTLTSCPECTGRLRKVFNAVGVVFKGSGFYRNDSRGKDTSAESSSTKTEAKTESKSESKSDSKSETKTETKTEKKSGTKSSDSATKASAASASSSS